MKICIISFSDRSIQHLSFPIMKSYCEKHNYDFITESKTLCPEHHPSWNTCYLPKKIFENNDYDFVVWIDDDIILTDLNKPITDFITDEKPITIQRERELKIMIKINGGFIIFHKSSLDILNNLIETSHTSVYKTKLPWEQQIIQNYLNTDEGSKNINVLPFRTLQSFSKYCHTWLHSDDNRWRQGDFCCHFAGVGYREKRMKDFIQNLHSKKSPKFVILTYKDNLPFAEETKQVLKDQWNIDADVFCGFKIGENNLKYNQVVMEGFKKLIENYDEDLYYLEDDVRFTKNPLDIDLTKDIVWSVYRNGKLTNKPPHNIITGIQAVYFSKDVICSLKKDIQGKRLVHFDNYISKFINKHPELSFEHVVPKMGYEKKHESHISQEKHWKRFQKPN
tara:strand:+ start:4200 stop:5378 length:1179 start_codon:yes stop_codon:yes gene_type:complete